MARSRHPTAQRFCGHLTRPNRSKSEARVIRTRTFRDHSPNFKGAITCVQTWAPDRIRKENRGHGERGFDI
jgi:hypothetical protein